MPQLQTSARSAVGFISAVVLFSVCSIPPAQGRDSVPVVNYEDRPISTTSGKPLSAAAVRELLVSAGDRYEWVFTDVGTDRLLGNLSWHDKHSIEVEITYSPERYSIRYRNSKNLNYDGAPPPALAYGYTAGKGNSYQVGAPIIHPEYNKRLKQLVDRIDFELRKR
jgi:hypothetical protein